MYQWSRSTNSIWPNTGAGLQGWMFILQEMNGKIRKKWESDDVPQRTTLGSCSIGKRLEELEKDWNTVKEIVCCKDSVVWSIVVLISSQEGFGEGIWMEVPSAHTDSVPLTLDGAVCREEVAYPCRIRSQRPVYVYLPPPSPSCGLRCNAGWTATCTNLQYSLTFIKSTF